VFLTVFTTKLALSLSRHRHRIPTLKADYVNSTKEKKESKEKKQTGEACKVTRYTSSFVLLFIIVLVALSGLLFALDKFLAPLMEPS